MKFRFESRWGAAAVLLASAGLVAGCGGGGSRSGGSSTPQNTAPMVSTISSQTINQDTSTQALTFTVSDDGGPNNVNVVVSSSDSTLLPTYGLVLGGSGASRTITVTPAEGASGVANVTLTAVDAQGGSTNLVFPITVSAVSKSIAAFTNSTFVLMEGDTAAQVNGITFTQDADDDATFTPLLQ
jgi:hypothetical protein